MKKNQSMIDIVDQYLQSDSSPRTLGDIIDYVAKEKEFEKNDIDKINQLYLDISTSGKYVYIGDNKWDLKERNLEYWNKDGIAFMSEEEKKKLSEVEEFNDLDFSDFDRTEFMKKLENIKEDVEDDDEPLDLADEEELEEKIEEAEYLDVELKPLDSDADDDMPDINEVELDFDKDEDEDKYNEAMDDYEYLYEE